MVTMYDKRYTTGFIIILITNVIKGKVNVDKANTNPAIVIMEISGANIMFIGKLINGRDPFL